jgi:PhzF family phenazine biosynthesis protein
MQLPLYQIDAFTRRRFGGNPAAVCPLPEWLPADQMQAIAAENNLAETAFIVGGAGAYDLRWFTPTIEVDLCGHATLASAHLILSELEPDRQIVTFQTRSGALTVERSGDGLLTMDFPSSPPEPCEPPAALVEALGAAPRETLRSLYYVAVLEDQQAVLALQPRMDALLRLDRIGLSVTAPGAEVDFVSRFFAPQAGIPEDPVTGSAHCVLTPYWSARLGKRRLEARQISSRVGELICEDRGARTLIAGYAVTYLAGTIWI